MSLSRNTTWLVALAAVSFSCFSCHKEDPALLRRNEEQKAEIRRLQGDLSLLEEKLKQAPQDRTNELAKAKKEADAQTAEITKLQAEVTDMESRKGAIEAEFKQYRDKYPLK